jgi:L-fucose isomerase
MPAKVGLVSLMCPEDSNHWAPAVIEQLTADHSRAAAALRGLGFEVATATDGLSRTNAEMIAHGKVLRNADIEVLVLNVGLWVYADQVVNLCTITDVPVVVWTYSSVSSAGRNVGICGGAITKGALDSAGIENTLVYGDYDETAALEEIGTVCRGYAAAARLRNTTMGVGGGRSMGMTTADADPIRIKQQFGVDIDAWDQGLVIAQSQQIPDADAEQVYQWMESTFGTISAKRNVVLSQIKMYLAMKHLVADKNYSSVCVRCLPELPEYHTTFCLAHTFLNDAEDADGPKEPVVCGCEADIHGTLTMELLKNVSGKSTVLVDVLVVDREENVISLSNCGAQSCEFCRRKDEVEFGPEILSQFTWKQGGITVNYPVEDGCFTLARLSRVGDEYVMLLFTGTGISDYLARKGIADQSGAGAVAANPPLTQANIQLDCSAADLVKELRSNHLHYIKGNYIEELICACRALGVHPILMRKET